MQKEELQDFIWRSKAGYPLSAEQVQRIAEWLAKNYDKVVRFTR